MNWALRDTEIQKVKDKIVGEGQGRGEKGQKTPEGITIPQSSSLTALSAADQAQLWQGEPYDEF